MKSDIEVLRSEKVGKDNKTYTHYGLSVNGVFIPIELKVFKDSDGKITNKNDLRMYRTILDCVAKDITK